MPSTAPREKITASIDARRRYAGPAFLQQGFRPFFLAAGVWSALALALWLIELRWGGMLPSDVSPVFWHAHEMLFGYGSAVVTGFLLTAVPNWTGRLPVRGMPLARLALLWLAGRAAFSIMNPAWLLVTSAIEGSYFLVLFGFLIREIVIGKNWRNLIVAGLVAGLAVANGLYHLERIGFMDSADIGIRLGIAVFVMLISLIGGRIVPSFTTNWLRKQGVERMPVPLGRFDKIALVGSLIGLVGWVASPDAMLSGWLILLAATLQAIRLSRWQGFRCFAEPLILMLHIGYGWLVVGLYCLGASILYDGFPQSAAVHGLTAGMIGSMTLVVMIRASLGHGGRKLKADLATTAIFALVFLAALTRVLAPVIADDYLFTLMLSGGLWIAAFTLFVVRYLPLWLSK
jgi:uncharacterized protein involved in response to NO